MLLSYVLRSLLKRLRANLVTALSIMLFVAGCTAGIAYYIGLRKQVVEGTPPEQVLVLSRGAASEGASRLSPEVVNKIMVLPGIKVDGTPLAARELLSSVGVSSEGSKVRGKPSVRGIEDSSYKVHGIKVNGAQPAPGSLEVIIGSDLLAEFPNMTPGTELTLPAGKAKIVGSFTGLPGDSVNSEIWMQRSALELHTKMKSTSMVLIMADSAAKVPELLAKINDSKDIEADAYSVRAYRSTQVGLEKIVKVVLLMVILLSVVAGLAISTTMSAAVSNRMPELAVLVTIGFRRGRLGQLVIMESVMLAAVGSLLGLAASFAVAKVLAGYSIKINLLGTPLALALGVGLGLAVGLIGGLVPAHTVRRLEIIKYMR